MSKLYITCWRDMAHDSNNRPITCPAAPPLGEMVLEIIHRSVTSDPFPPYTHFISIKAMGDCAIAFNDAADPLYHVVEANERLWYGVTPDMTISVIGVMEP